MKTPLLKIVFIAFLTLMSYFSLAQSVTLTPEGAWVPSMTTTARTALTPTVGQLVFDTTLGQFYFYSGTDWTAIPLTTTASLTTSYVPRWNGSTFVNSSMYDTGLRVAIGATTFSNESRLALGALSTDEGGQLQLNSRLGGSVAYHLDNYNDKFRLMTGINTASSEVLMAMTSDGKMGVGTETPTEKLEVSGKTKTTNFQMTNGATNGYLLQSDANGNGSWVSPSNLSLTETDPQVASSTTNYVPKWNGTALQDGILYDNGTRVGIGTTSMANESRLALGAVDDNEGEGGQLQLNSASSSTRAYYLDNSNDVFRIMSGTNTGATDLRMKISSTGDVGIGLIGTPRGKLDVDGKTVTNNFQMTNGATNGYILQSDASGNGSWVANSAAATTKIQDADGNTKVEVEQSANENKIRFTQNGTEYHQFNKGTLEFNNTGGSTYLGYAAGANDSYVAVKSNVGIGANALQYATSGGQNVALGCQSLQALTLGINNVAVGNEALNKLTVGYDNVAVGFRALINNTSNLNVAVGKNAGYWNTSGDHNTFLGAQAGESNTGSDNVFIGWRAGWFEEGSNKLYIANTATTTPLIHGDFSTKTLTVNDYLATKYFKLTNGATNGYVLQSDANGNASWVNPTSFATAETDPQVASSTTNYVPKWNGTALQDGILYDKGTGIGIGTTTVATESRLAVGAAGIEEGGQIQLNAGSLRFVAYFLDNSEDKFRIMSGTNSGSTSTHLTITESGNVGLGTQSPAEKLDVQGKTKTTNFQMTEGATNNYVLQSDASGNATWVNPSTLTTASSNWTTSGTNQYSALSGNVGIGTTSPTTKLHVSGNSTLAGTVNFNNDWNIQTGSDFWLEKNGTRHLTVYGFDGATGIATATPKSTLDVNGSVGYKISTQSGSTAVTLDNSATVWYFTGSASITLPDASSCPNRYYKIMNRNYGNRTISSFINHIGLPTTSISANSAIEIISDGTNWLKIN
jgi:hypothetical protein